MITNRDFAITCILKYFLILSFIITYSITNEYIYKANNINAVTNTNTPHKLISIDSPISKSNLRDIANAGGEFMQVIYRYEPEKKNVKYTKTLGLLLSNSIIVGFIGGIIISMINGIIIGIIIGIIGGIIIGIIKGIAKRKILGTILGTILGAILGAMLGAMLGAIAGVVIETINLYDKQ